MSEGYIKLYRDIQNWDWYTDNNAKALYLHCLLRANWNPSLFQGHRIEAGEFVTSANRLAGETGMTISQIRTALDKLKQTGEVTEYKIHNYRVIRVTNYRLLMADGGNCGTASSYAASIYDAGTGTIANSADAYNIADSFASIDATRHDSKSQADHEQIDPIEEGKKERNSLSVSSTNVSDTDCQPRPAAGADAALFAGLPAGSDEPNKSAGTAITLTYDPDLEAVNAGNSLKGVPAKSRGRDRVREIRQVIDAWNTLEADGIKGITSISPDSKRFHALHARLNQHGVDKVLAAIELVRESDFLRGVNKNGWVITFDWFVRPNNFNKVLDGNYANRSPLAVIGSLDTSWLEH